MNPSINNPSHYPIHTFPTILQDVIISIHSDTQFPVEMIGSTVLAAAALACQGYAEAISPFTDKPEPCSLYFLTLAPQSAGKSTLYSEIMSPFSDFTRTMKEGYQDNLKHYKNNREKWNIKKSALASNLRKAIRDGDIDAEQTAQELFDEHVDSLETIAELVKPKKFNLIYEDVTFKALVEGLRDQPNAAVLSSEAITFFKGRLKGHLGFLNKAWSGEVYPYHRSDEEDLELNARLTMLLMVQPQVFMNYLKKSDGEPDDSGFLSRFLITNPLNTSNAFKGLPDRTISIECLTRFHQKITELLEKQKPYFFDSSLPKDKSPLDNKVKDAFSAWINKNQGWLHPLFKWGHIPGHVKKAGSHAIRIATIFSIFEHDKTSIDVIQLQKSTQLVDWYIDQAGLLFYPFSSLYKFREDVYELFEWIKSRIRSPGKGRVAGAPLPKQFIENGGPNRFRQVKALTPVLDELISIGKVVTIRYRNSHTEYVAEPVFDSYTSSIQTVKCPRHTSFDFVKCIKNIKDAPSEALLYDFSRLEWDD